MKTRNEIIPKDARSRVVKRHRNGTKLKEFYYVSGQRIGWRTWDTGGRLYAECAMKNGLNTGPCRYFNNDGTLNWELPYVNGKAHGVSRQYDRSGKVIGTSQWNHGTGADLWYHQDGELSEERYIQDGHWNGFERWWYGKLRVRCERHFRQDIEHGIHREWNAKGDLRRGFPRYFVNGTQVSKQQYIRASEKDPSLPRFRETDNNPQRELPTGRSSGQLTKGRR